VEVNARIRRSENNLHFHEKRLQGELAIMRKQMEEEVSHVMGGEELRDWNALVRRDPVKATVTVQVKTCSFQRMAPLEQELKELSRKTELKKLQKTREQIVQNLHWLDHAEEYLEGIRSRAAWKLAEVNAKQAKEYQELFPRAWSQPDPVPDLNVEIMYALLKQRVENSPADQVSQKETNGEICESTSAFSKGLMAKNPLGVRGVDAVQGPSHRWPPTDRPPDRPDRGRSVYGGCSLERASTQSPVYHLASFLSLLHSLSGRSAPFAEIAIYGVRKPSDCQVPSQVGSSHEFDRVLSWMHPRCGRLRRVSSQRYVPRPIQRCSMAQRDRVTRPLRE
jgi:hypothetical protein